MTHCPYCKAEGCSIDCPGPPAEMLEICDCCGSTKASCGRTMEDIYTEGGLTGRYELYGY